MATYGNAIEKLQHHEFSRAISGQEGGIRKVPSELCEACDATAQNQTASFQQACEAEMIAIDSSAERDRWTE
jgi:hypothetical protein